MGISKTSDHNQMNIKMLRPSQEPPTSSKAPNDDFKDMDVLCTLKTTMECQNLDHVCIKEQWPYPNQDKGAKPQSGTSSILQSPKQDLKHIDVLCTFKIKIESKNSDHGCVKDQWPYPNQDQDAKPQSATSRILQGPKLGLKGHGYSLHLKKIKIESKNSQQGYIKDKWLYQNQSYRFETPVRNLQHPPKPQMRT